VGGRGSLGIRKINAFGPDGWNSDAFAGGLASGLLSSGSTFVGSSVSNGINVALGASWNNGGYNYTVAYDQTNKITLLDYYNDAMKQGGNVLGNLVTQGIDNLTGVADGYTFNILNAGDFGIKDKKGNLNTTGLFAVTLGGSKGLSCAISSDGLDLSLNSIKNLTKGMKRASEYNNMTSASNKEKNAVYIAENLMLYSGVSEDDDILKQIDSYLYGDQGAINIDFSTEDNKREGNTIYLNKNYIGSMNYDGHTVIVNNFNQYAVLGAKLGHELYHDGSNNISSDVANNAQQDLNAMLASGTDYNQALGYIIEKYGADVAREINEDIQAHTYETGIWGKMKNTFGVSNDEMDLKLYTLNETGKLGFVYYLSNVYNLGQEKSDAYSLVRSYNFYRAELAKATEKENGNIIVSAFSDLFSSKEKLENIFLYTRQQYISYLEKNKQMDKYTKSDFNYDMVAMYGEKYKINVTDEDYSKLIDYICKDLGMTKEQVLKQMGTSFNNIFNLVYSQGKEGLKKYNILNSEWSKSFEFVTGENNKSYYNDSHSTAFLFGFYKESKLKDNAAANSSNELDYEYTGKVYTFLEYYMKQDLEDINKISLMIKDKNIKIKDSDLGDNWGTNFLANIDLLYSVLHDIHASLGGQFDKNGNLTKTGNWSGFTFIEGFRDPNDGSTKYSPHKFNIGIDIVGLKDLDGQDISVKTQLKMLKYFEESHHYLFMEWKPAAKGSSGGFHLGGHCFGYYSYDNPGIVYGNYPSDSEKSALTILKNLGIDVENEELKNQFMTKGTSYWIVNLNALYQYIFFPSALDIQ